MQALQQRVQQWWSQQHEHDWAEVSGESLDGLLFSGYTVQCGWGPCGWQNGRDWATLVSSLRPFVTGELVIAARKLEQPDVQWTLAIASSLVPRPIGDEIQLVADIIEAAGAQSVQERKKALVGAGVAIAGIVTFLVVASGSKNG